MVKSSIFCCHSSALCLYPAMMKFKFGGVMQPTNLILYGRNTGLVKIMLTLRL